MQNRYFGSFRLVQGGQFCKQAWAPPADTPINSLQTSLSHAQRQVEHAGWREKGENFNRFPSQVPFHFLCAHPGRGQSGDRGCTQEEAHDHHIKRVTSFFELHSFSPTLNKRAGQDMSGTLSAFNSALLLYQLPLHAREMQLSPWISKTLLPVTLMLASFPAALELWV